MLPCITVAPPRTMLPPALEIDDCIFSFMAILLRLAFIAHCCGVLMFENKLLISINYVFFCNQIFIFARLIENTYINENKTFFFILIGYKLYFGSFYFMQQ